MCFFRTRSCGEEKGKGITNHVSDIVDAGKPESIARTDSRNLEDLGPVDGDTGDTDPLLENLQPDDELDAAAGMEFARLETEEHGEVTALTGGLALELDNVADVLELGLGETVVLAAESAEDEAALLLAPDLDEPARGFRHGVDDGEEEEQGHDLEGDGEAPDEGGVLLGIECAATAGYVSDLVLKIPLLQALLTIPTSMRPRHQKCSR